MACGDDWAGLVIFADDLLFDAEGAHTRNFSHVRHLTARFDYLFRGGQTWFVVRELGDMRLWLTIAGV